MTITGSSWSVRRHPGDDAARRAGVAVLRSALSGLSDGAGHAGSTGREHRLSPPACRTTRAALYDYVKGSLAPSRQRRVERHLDRCGQCTRAFVDVRVESWALRGLGRRLAARDHQGGQHRRPARRTRY